MASLTSILTATPTTPPTYNVGMAETFSWVPVEGAGRPLFARATYLANPEDIKVSLSAGDISVGVDTSALETLILSPSLKSILESTQETFQNNHKASPVELTNGTFMLCADLLTEIQPGGLYAQGFGLLDADLFSQVEVISMEEASALLPVSEEV